MITIIIVFLLTLYFYLSIITVKGNEKAVVAKKEKYTKVLEPGWYILPPPFYQITPHDVTYDEVTRFTVEGFTGEDKKSKDPLDRRVKVALEVVIRARKDDPLALMLNIGNDELAQHLENQAVYTIMAMLPKKTLRQHWDSIETISQEIEEALNTLIENPTEDSLERARVSGLERPRSWGVKISEVNILKFLPDELIMQALDEVSRATLTGKSQIIKSRADREEKKNIAIADAFKLKKTAEAKAQEIKLTAEQLKNSDIQAYLLLMEYYKALHSLAASTNKTILPFNMTQDSIIKGLISGGITVDQILKDKKNDSGGDS